MHVDYQFVTFWGLRVQFFSEADCLYDPIDFVVEDFISHYIFI